MNWEAIQMNGTLSNFRMKENHNNCGNVMKENHYAMTVNRCSCKRPLGKHR